MISKQYTCAHAHSLKKLRIAVITMDIEQDFPTTLATNNGIYQVPYFVKILEKHHARGTFYITAETIEKFSDFLLANLANHEVGCHGLKHERYDQLNPVEQYRQLEKALDIFEDLFSLRPVSFRAPYLRINKSILENVKKLGFICDSSSSYLRGGRCRVEDGLVEIPVSIPYILPTISTTLTRMLVLSLPSPIVFLFHSWQFLDLKNRIFRKRCGHRLFENFERILVYLKRKGFRILTIQETAKLLLANK